MHLTDDSYRGILSGRLTGAEAAALAHHLEAPCDQCEGWLEAHPADGLDGRVDAALLSLAPVQCPPAAGDLAFARVERALRRQVPPARRRWVPALAVAATLAVAGLAALLRPAPPGPAPWDGVKGATAAAAVPLKLRFLVLTPSVGGPPALERGRSGQEVPASGSLQFEVELGRPANVLLARAGKGGAPEVFFTAALGAGRHAVTADGRPAAYPLASLAGPQRFLALASEAPLGAGDAVRAAARQADAGGGQAQGLPITLDEVEVRVRP